MAKRHSDDVQQKGETIEQSDEKDPNNGPDDGVSASRRSVLRGAAAAATTLGTVGVFSGGAAAASGLPIQPDGKAVVEPGEYTWGSGDIEIGPDAALVGGGEKGDVVVNLGCTMLGSVRGRIENIVVRGDNPEPTSSLEPYPGATIDGFIWPEGGQKHRDHAFFTPEGGDERVTIRNSAWAFNVNNGAYCDKPAMTFENCAAVNNNISGIRVGHRRGTPSDMVSYVRNCLVAVTADIPNDDVNTSNGRGVRVRYPGNFVIENCHFIYRDVHGATNPIIFSRHASGSSVTVRNCTFYNETDNALLRDKTGGDVDVTVENCQAVGPGSYEFEQGDVSESDLAADGDVSFPLPSEVTGYAAADEINGVGPGIGPWDDSPYPDQGNENSEDDHAIVLHASPDNPDGNLDVEFVVDGAVEYGKHAESDTDSIEENGDGTVTVTSTLMGPDTLDSYRYSGKITEYDVPDGYEVDISVDGTTTTFTELVGDEFAIVAQEQGSLSYEFEVDGAVEKVELSSKVRAGPNDSIDSSGETTIVNGFTGNPGYGDAYEVHGDILRFEITDGDIAYNLRLNGEPISFEDSADDGVVPTDDENSGDQNATDSLPHMLIVDGDTDLTQYTFTVSGEVERAPQWSVSVSDSMPTDKIQDIARGGKVIGVVGIGVDAYRYSGHLTAFSIDGDANIDVRKNV